jgi:hypothetical protein
MTDSTDNARGLDLDRLISWGFAPGSYMGFCSECGRQHTADKRAWRCLECAERRADLAPDPQDARVAALLEALIAMLGHSGVADAGPDMKDPEDHAAERQARAALAAFDKGGKDD